MASKSVLVKNRSNMQVIYNLPEMGIRREFAPGETKKLTVEAHKFSKTAKEKIEKAGGIVKEIK